MSLLSAATTVLVVAPPTLQRQGLLATLRDARPDLPVTTTADIRSLPERLRRDAPTLLVLDAARRGASLEALIGQARATNPDVRILVVGGKKLPFSIARLIVEMGGGMLLNRHATPGELVAAVGQLIGTPAPTGFDAEEPRKVYNAWPTAERDVTLSRREREVLDLVVADCTNQEIAARLSISVRTVECHRRLLLEKAGTRSMIGLVLHAVRSGWVSMV